jgi:hypothetical protein
MHNPSDLSVNVVLGDFSRGWIIEKIALQLCDALRELGTEAAVTPHWSSHTTVNHSIIFHYAPTGPCTLNTMGITHVDDALKIDMIRRAFASGVRAGICMSSMTVDQLVGYGFDPKKLTYALPAHDNTVAPRRVVIGITSNNQADGRKRAWVLSKLSEDISLDDFEFQIFGWGWEEVSARLRAAGAKVILKNTSDDYQSGYDEIKSSVPYFDYYFYPGLDEGSLGTLDALAAGVKTIVTDQGFHRDLSNGITYSFWDYRELRDIFDEIIRERRARIEIARSLTWARYARRHLDIWTSLIEKHTVPAPDLLGGKTSYRADSVRASQPRRRYGVEGYPTLLANQMRRNMAEDFWLRRADETYVDGHSKVARILSRVVVERVKTSLRKNVPPLFEFLKGVKQVARSVSRAFPQR